MFGEWITVLLQIICKATISVQVSSGINSSRLQSSTRGTHSKIEPRAIQKNFFLFFACHLPLLPNVLESTNA